MSQVIYKQRKNTNSTKWDTLGEKFGKEELLPLWIADMDFEAPSCVKDALGTYVEQGVFGYYTPPERYKEAFIQWEKTYHDYEVKPEWICFAPGVVPAINWLIHILTEEGDAVLFQPPVYYPFREAIVNNGRRPVENPLVRTENSYVMDAEDFEKKIVSEDVKLFILCSPHNPVGRVWKEEEIKKVLDICRRHHVYVLADEIHQDIIMKGFTQKAAASMGDYDDILITITAATKTFNLAACQNSILVIPDERLRGLYEEYLVRLRIKGGNPFGYIAVQSAYEQGRPWLQEVMGIIEGNYRYLKETLEEALPRVWIPDMEGTYLMWIGLEAYIKPEEMERVILEECALAVDFGSWFGGSGNDGFIRVNLATCRENIELTAKRLIRALQ